MIVVVNVGDTGWTAGYCQHCGRLIEWVLRRDVMMPREGVVKVPFRFMPCGCFVDPADAPPPRHGETSTAGSL